MLNTTMELFVVSDIGGNTDLEFDIYVQLSMLMWFGSSNVRYLNIQSASVIEGVCSKEKITHRYFNTSANQKLSVSSILLVLTSLTSSIAANPVDVFKNLLKLSTALAARSRYFGSPVTLNA